MNHFTSVVPNHSQLPAFRDLENRPIITELKDLIEKSEVQLDALLTEIQALSSSEPICWEYMRRLDTIQANILNFWMPVDHIHSVAQTSKIKKIHQEGLPLITKWETELSQNKRFCEWIKRWVEHADFAKLDYAQQKVLKNIFKQFALSGVYLDQKKQERYKALALGLAKDSAQFETNIVNSSLENPIWVQNESQLQGLPERFIAMALKVAHEAGQSGWLFRLNGPNLQVVMTNAKDRSLRQAFYKAWVTRASEKTQFDNSDLMYRILHQRHELSQLVNLNNYAERSLADNKMADSTQAVVDFLNHLVAAARPHAEKELKTLQDFAKQQGHMDALCPWDIPYFSEKLRCERFGLEQEQLRMYFPLSHVLKAFYEYLHDQFQITLKEISLPRLWDPEIIVLSIEDKQGMVRGYLYLDLYAREGKRSGAWLHEYTRRRVSENDALQLPIAFLTCNFATPSENEPALITHGDVVTLFHEMGHALHHTLTQVNEAGVSGIEGVPWDAVEFPSQLLEQFAWESLVLKRVSAHYHTGESLPDDKIQALSQSRRFQAGLHFMRQLEFGLFDFQLHLQFDPEKSKEQIQVCLDTVREKTRVLSSAAFDRFQHSFAHIFSGGYGAGYYSYLWAEVLAADAFGRFLEEGLQKGQLNPKTGQAFMESVLELGGAVDIVELFKRFRKRVPDEQAFLKQWGLLSDQCDDNHTT